MVAVIGAIEGVVRPDMQAVRIAEDPLAPAVEEAPVAIEDDHRVGAAIEQEDAVLAVDRDRGDLLQGPAFGQAAPVGHGFVAEVAAAEDVVHGCVPLA